MSALVERDGENASGELAIMSILDSGDRNPFVPTGTISYWGGGAGGRDRSTCDMVLENTMKQYIVQKEYDKKRTMLYSNKYIAIGPLCTVLISKMMNIG